MAARGGRYAARLAAVLAAVLLTAGACSDASPDSPPTGVDELTVPTPSPDPDDFVRGVDNPWLALRPGATWRYRVTGEPSGTMVVTVEDVTYEIAGVATTPVSRTEPTGEQVVDYFAQDRAGNVWWLGREGVWKAGEDGAEAGLAMPASPRVGDGWRAAYVPDEVDARVTVVNRTQVVSTPAGHYDHVLALDLTDPLEPDSARRSYYARGVGLVEEFSTSGPGRLADLVSGPG